MIDHGHSGKLNMPYICKYSNIRKLPIDKVTGYKLVRKRNLNYYSISTGLYRYKPGYVSGTTNYWRLYKNTDYFIEELSNRTAVFKTLSDLEEFYPDHINDQTAIILEVKLEKDLLKMTCTNNRHSCDVIAGKYIESIREIV